jgi:mono/diheme cytochrome c family protein
MKPTILLTAALAVTAGALIATAKEVDASKIPPASDRKDVTYVRDIKPIFDNSCIKCHGPEKQKAKMRLDSLEFALKGAKDGKVKVIKPGDSAKSELVHSVARLGDEDHWMPPEGKGDPLTAAQVGLIRAWIDQGAK